jgi:hypothetical protein
MALKCEVACDQKDFAQSAPCSSLDSRLVSPRHLREAAAVEKKRLRQLHALAEKLKALPHLDEAERLLFAQSLTASPDERWLTNHHYIQLVKSSQVCAPKKSAF